VRKCGVDSFFDPLDHVTTSQVLECDLLSPRCRSGRILGNSVLDLSDRPIRDRINRLPARAIVLILTLIATIFRYSKLQELAGRVELELQNRGLKPHSRIDVQGFIWASIGIEDGKYGKSE
jgi:hypothetical protein